MKKPQRIALWLFVAVLGTGAVMKINQAPSAHAAAPGESSCGACHGGNVNTGPGSVTLGLPPNGYQPGQTYTLTHTVTDASFTNPKYGFSATALNASNQPVGNFIVTNTAITSLQTSTVAGAIRQYLGHVGANNTNTWTFDWTAPVTNVGPVTFYTASIAANGNNSTSGDNAYHVAFSLQPYVPVPPTSDFGIGGSLCLDNPLVFSDSSTGDINTYSWSFGPNASISTASTSGPHTISFDTVGPQTIQLITTGTAGTDTLTQTIQINGLPIANAGLDTSLCENENGFFLNGTALAGMPPFLYQWAGDTAINNPSLANPFVRPEASTVLTLTLTDQNGCTSEPDSVNITLLPPPMAYAGPDLFLCRGTGEFIQGGLAANNLAPGPYSFNWVPASGLSSLFVPNPFANPDTTTTYLLQVTAGNGCISEMDSLNQTSQVTVFVIDTIGVDLGPDLMICEGDTLRLAPIVNGGPAGSFAWTSTAGGFISDTAVSNPRISPVATGIYQLVVASPNACADDTSTLTVTVNPLPLVPSISFADDTLFATGTGSFQWYYYAASNGDTIEIAGATEANLPYNPFYTLATATGVVLLAHTNANGCTVYTEPYTMPFPTDVTVIVDPWYGQRVYPNPVQGQLGIEFSYTGEAATELEIFDLQGKRVFSKQYPIAAFDRDEIEVSSLSTGIYFARFRHGAQTDIKKFVKQ